MIDGATKCPRCGRPSPRHEADPTAARNTHDTYGEAMTTTSVLMSGMLATAVPVAIDGLRWAAWPELQRIAHEAADVVASQGDILQFRGAKKGDTARAFGALARGLAALAYCPGGVTFLGEHWCAKHPDSSSRDGQYAEAAR